MEQLLFPDFVSECASSVKRLSAAYQICHKFMIIQISATLPHHRSKDLFKVLRIILNYYVGSLYENITLGHCQERLKQVRHKVWRETKNRIKILIEIALSFYFGSHLAILNASSQTTVQQENCCGCSNLMAHWASCSPLWFPVALASDLYTIFFFLYWDLKPAPLEIGRAQCSILRISNAADA